MKAKELRQWSRLPSKGKVVLSFADDKHGNSWLYKPELLKPCRFITALRLRSGMKGDRVVLLTVTPQHSVLCRRCGSQLETLAHVLGQCSHTKTKRIGRHNDIRDFVATRIANNDGAHVIEEPTIRTSSGPLKPDLVVIHQTRVHVVDVTVRHEDVGYLDQAYTDKVDKYTPLLPILAEDRVRPGRVLPVVVGTRGAIPKHAVASLRERGIDDDQSLQTITLLALRSSVEIYNAFLDYNGRII
jgi:hypothetical protein